MRRTWFFINKGEIVREKTPVPRLFFFLYETRVGGAVRLLFIMPWVSFLVGLYKKSFFSKWEIDPFMRRHDIKRSDFLVPPGGYASFNDFFIRKLAPGVRDIAQGEKIVTSPGDAKLSVHTLGEKEHFIIKNTSFSLASFLSSAEEAALFAGGTLFIFRLTPSDYHRFHLPYGGVLGAPRLCGGRLDSVQPAVFLSGRQPFITNKRVIIPVANKEISLDYRIIAVGALCVGKVVCLYDPRRLYARGDELGYFEFGGSTVCVLFKKGEVVVEPSFLEYSQRGYEVAVAMGEPVARLNN